MTDLIIIPVLLWLAICAYQDYHTGEVSNWLTLPPLGLALVARLVSWLATPWWIIFTIWMLALILWHNDRLGGADAKAWMTFSLLGNGILWSAYMGLLIWYAAVTWVFASLVIAGACPERVEGTRRFPGFPGYLLGVSGAALILTGSRLFHIIIDVAFILMGTMFLCLRSEWRFFCLILAKECGLPTTGQAFPWHGGL
ncbi:MAG: prepilin peptidase [Anaerolineales bacterium]|nr:prepilin peptidase [Anaerolineales bacterium]